MTQAQEQYEKMKSILVDLESCIDFYNNDDLSYSYHEFAAKLLKEIKEHDQEASVPFDVRR